jgi:PAS domain S-box-containing protein
MSEAERGDGAGRTDRAGDRFFELSLDLLCVAGVDGYFKKLNPAWEQTLGYSLDELYARPILELIHPDDRVRSGAVTPKLLAGGEVTQFENRYLCKDGSYRWISWTCGAARADDRAFYAVGRDVTAYRLARETLNTKTLELEAVFRALPDLLFRTDAEGRIVDYSAGRTSDLFVSPEAFLGKTFRDVLPSAVGEALAAAVARAHRGATVESIEYELELAAGAQWFEARLVPFIEGQTITVVRNVTDRKEAHDALKRSEDRLRESEKLEAIGRLAGGIAHDFNNLMMAVLTYGRLLLRKLPEDDPRRRDVVEICDAGERAARLTRQLLAFARRQFLQPTALDCGAVVGEMEGTLKGLVGDRVALKSTRAPGLFRARVDRSQLEQVVLNLVLNARDAMPAGGTLEIAVANAEIDAAEARRLELPRAGSYVRLTVADTGGGIAPEVRPHVFEPFYTTKAPGEGTGLGLATVYGIVRQSGGSVAVESAPGAGATFSILLPRTDDETPAIRSAARAELPGGSETVLVVEDDAAVRRAIVATLRSLGYEVLEADGGAAALRVVASHAGPIHLALTDVVMPAVGGYQLVALLREASPATNVLLMSGHASAAPEAAGEAQLLQKPFDPATLAVRVRDALDGRVAEKDGDGGRPR